MTADELFQDWLPTPEAINELPEPLRRYIMELETLADPSGLVSENTQLRDVNRELQASNRMLRDQLDAGRREVHGWALPGPTGFGAFQRGATCPPGWVGMPHLVALCAAPRDLAAAASARPPNCGSGHCSCVECPFGPSHQAGLPGQAAGACATIAALQKELLWYKERAAMLESHASRDCWYWQGDGEDHLESMVNSLTIVIRASQLRDLLAKATEVPEGCTPADARVLRQANHEMAEELHRLHNLINAPELHDFARGVVLEAAHQRERWGVDHDAGKQPEDWFWLLGYLAGKALSALKAEDSEKALHHTISSAAALANWHAAISGSDNRMRPGIDAIERGVEPANDGRVADEAAHG